MLPFSAAALALLASWLAAPMPSSAAPVASTALAHGDDWQEAVRKGEELYNAKKYAESIVEYEKVLAAADAPQDAKAHSAYNAGCCYALLGNKEKAVEFVVKSIDLGFYDFDHIAKDTDLDTVRDDPRLVEAMRRNRAKKDEQDAKEKRSMEEARKEMDTKLMSELPAALEKLRDPKGAGFAFTFDLKTFDGKPISSKSLEGKVAIVDIWGTWCGPCLMEIPHFVEVAKRHKADPFAIVGLNDEDRKQNRDRESAARKVASFAEKNGINYSLALIDTKTFEQVPDFEGYPTTLFLDRTGRVRLAETGYRPLAYIDAIVSALLKESAVGLREGSTGAPKDASTSRPVRKE
jgi:thiol-disulfide isomerase/thioredoxin